MHAYIHIITQLLHTIVMGAVSGHGHQIVVTMGRMYVNMFVTCKFLLANHHIAI